MSKKRFAKSSNGSTQEVFKPMAGSGDTFDWFAKHRADIPTWKRRIAGHKAARRHHPVKVTLAGQS